MFVLDDIEYVRKYGDRQSVYDGVCYCTTGGLTKENLEKRGARIISKRRSALGKLRYKEKNPFIPESPPDLPPPPLQKRNLLLSWRRNRSAVERAEGPRPRSGCGNFW